MKNHRKLLIAVTALMLMLITAGTAFASDYTIYDAWWDCEYSDGTAVIRWDKCAKSTKYQVQLFRAPLGSGISGNGKIVVDKNVSGDHYDATNTIYEKGRGTYYFVITPVNSKNPLDDMYVGVDTLDVDHDFLEQIRRHHEPDKPTNINGWVFTNNNWKYLHNGEYVKNCWKFINHYWYYFNRSGVMLTGWQWVDGRCYYLNPVQGAGGYPEGACWINGVTPDGYTVDGSGAWTVNGYIQTR